MPVVRPLSAPSTPHALFGIIPFPLIPAPHLWVCWPIKGSVKRKDIPTHDVQSFGRVSEMVDIIITYIEDSHKFWFYRKEDQVRLLFPFWILTCLGVLCRFIFMDSRLFGEFWSGSEYRRTCMITKSCWQYFFNQKISSKLQSPNL